MAIYHLEAKVISRGMLNEEAERQAVRRMVQQAQKIPNNKKDKGQDRYCRS